MNDVLRFIFYLTEKGNDLLMLRETIAVYCESKVIPIQDCTDPEFPRFYDNQHIKMVR